MPLNHHSHLKYRAFVDGLRAVAVLPVIFFHADLGFGGGYVGVDVFFVISGYLITGLILKDLDSDRFRITEFWERRIRRILPVLAVVVLSCLVAGWFLYFPQDFKELGQSVVAQAALVSNIFFYKSADYFAQEVDIKPLLHTWSLAVEEQFYLIFPLLLIGLRRFPRKSRTPTLLVLCGLSFCLSVYSSYKHPRANFYLLPTRAWELLIGSFLASISEERPSARWLTESTSWAGLLGILCAVFFYKSDTRFPGVAAVLPCGGAALVIWANTRTVTFAGKLLSAWPVVFIGLVSYSLYLWHWPVLVFFKYWHLEPVSRGQRLLLLILSLGLAILSWRFVETPFRKRVILKKRPQIFAFAGAVGLTLLVAGLTVTRLQGVSSRIPQEALQYLDSTTITKGSPNPDFNRQLTLNDARGGNFIELGRTDTNLPVGLLVWGDSHAAVELPVLDALCGEHSVRGVAAVHSQTAPLVGYESQGVWSLSGDSTAFNNAVVEFIRNKRVPDVLIIARWDYYVDYDQGTDRLRNALCATLNGLRNSGARVWIMRQVPKYPWNVPKALASSVLHGHNPEDLGRPLPEQVKMAQSQDPIFQGIETMFSGVTILDPTRFFIGPSGRCRVAEGGKPLYFDTDHVNIAGAMMLRPLFDPIFGGINKGPPSVRN